VPKCTSIAVRLSTICASDTGRTFGDGELISHQIEAASSPGVDEWHVTHDLGVGWKGAAKATETKIPIMKALAEVSDELSFEFRPYRDGGSFI